MLIMCKLKRIHGHEPYKYVTESIAEWKVSGGLDTRFTSYD